MASNVQFLGNIKGPTGAKGDQGDQGIPGVNGVTNDAANATNTANPASQTRGALDTLFSKPAIPANVLALTRDGTRNQNAAAVLRPWYAALANRANQRVDVAVLADSIGEGGGATTLDKRWVSRLASNLRTRFPVPGVVGGRGFIGTFATNGVWATFPWPCTITAGVTTGSVDYGLKRNTQGMEGGTATFALNGTSAGIMYPQAPGFGKLTYRVDGGAPVVLDQLSATERDGIHTLVNLGAAGAHTLVISGNANSYLNGVIEYNGDETAGVMAHDCGHGGYRSDEWAGAGFDPVKRWPANYTTLNPAVLIIALGVNDVAQFKTAAAFKAAMTILLSTLRGATQAPIVLLPYAAVQGAMVAWPAFVTAMYELAVTDGKAVVADLSLRLPNYDDTSNLGAFFDGNHPNNKGHAMIADFLANFLSPS